MSRMQCGSWCTVLLLLLLSCHFEAGAKAWSSTASEREAGAALEAGERPEGEDTRAKVEAEGQSRRGVESLRAAFVLPPGVVGAPGAQGAEGEERTLPPHLKEALKDVGVTERGGNNRGPEVKRYLKVTGLGEGYPWCAAFVSYALEKAHPQPEGPKVRSAASRHFINPPGMRSVQAARVARGEVRPAPGWILVWRRGNTPYGHVGFVVGDDRAAERGPAWYKRCGRTVEGNTSSGRAGSQRDGDGVYERHRCIEPYSYFRITHFTPVAYG